MPPPKGYPHSETSILQKMKLKKGHNSYNNWQILRLIKLDLYFMMIYLCLKYESNTLIFSKGIEQKPYFVHMDWMMRLKRGHNSHNTQWILP